jgi:hypothetical protein
MGALLSVGVVPLVLLGSRVLGVRRRTAGDRGDPESEPAYASGDGQRHVASL